jgi:SAM-dependent methyltransferase
MPEQILVQLQQRVCAHPWWRARARLALDLLSQNGVRPPASVLDAGCGWGVNLMALEKHGYRATGLDVSLQALQRLEQNGRSLIEADLTQDVPRDAGRFDAVLALDVIEHLDDDVSALRRLADLTAPGGILIVSVPALPELYSEFDEVQGHRRRYLPDTLQAAFRDAPVQITRLFWWGAWMVPLLRRRRLKKRARAGATAAETYAEYLKLPPWPASLALRLAFAWEHGPALAGKKTTGTSLFAVAKRK